MGNGYDILEVEGKSEARGMWMGFVRPIGDSPTSVSPHHGTVSTMALPRLSTEDKSPTGVSAAGGANGCADFCQQIM